MENNVWKCIKLNFYKLKTLDEVVVDEMGVDQMGVDEMESRRSGNKPNNHYHTSVHVFVYCGLMSVHIKNCDSY